MNTEEMKKLYESEPDKREHEKIQMKLLLSKTVS